MEKEIEKKELDEKIDDITKYLFDEYGDEIKEDLGTSEDGTKYRLYINVYHTGHVVVELLNIDNYRMVEPEIELYLGRINIYDDYDLNEAFQILGDSFSENDIEDDAFDFFKENFDFEGWIKEIIEEQLTSEEIKKLYNLIFLNNNNKKEVSKK